MRRAAIATLGLLGAVFAAESAAPGSDTPVAQLSWLAGCWAYADPGSEPGSGETWMPPAGGQLLGIARVVRGGRVVSYELQRIVESETGLALLVSPSGQPEVRFDLASLTVNEVVFENAENDFPRRVIYRLAQSGDISARIEGAREDPARAVDFPMKRTSCEEAKAR